MAYGNTDPLRKIVRRQEQVQTIRIWIELECGHKTSTTRAARTPFTAKSVRCWACGRGKTFNQDVAAGLVSSTKED